VSERLRNAERPIAPRPLRSSRLAFRLDGVAVLRTSRVSHDERERGHAFRRFDLSHRLFDPGGGARPGARGARLRVDVDPIVVLAAAAR